MNVFVAHNRVHTEIQIDTEMPKRNKQWSALISFNEKLRDTISLWIPELKTEKE